MYEVMYDSIYTNLCSSLYTVYMNSRLQSGIPIYACIKCFLACIPFEFLLTVVSRKLLKSGYCLASKLFLFIQCLITLNSSSIGLKSGEYGEKYVKITPRSAHASVRR